jgi:hypothetical protein
MNRIMLIVAASLVAALGFAPVAHAEQPAPVARDYDVFVDPPTGFVFVKLPQGWKFVGKVDEAEMAHLPSTVLTWLLPPEADDATRMARAKRDAAPAKGGKS